MLPKPTGDEEPEIKLLGRRVIVLRAGTFVDIQKSVENLLGEEAQALFYEAGIRAGRGSAKVQLEKWGERGEDFIKKWGKFYTSVGWLKIEKININKQNKQIRIKKSFIADEYGESDKPVCHFLAGFFVGVFKEVFSEELTCEETMCTAKGDPCCEFKLEKYR